MLVIRLQRTGRKGHAQFRVVVQDSRRTPTSGKIVAQVGTYDPHGKVINLNKERAEHYLAHGAQPSPRVVSLLKAEGVKLPSWVEKPAKRSGKIRNPEKLRRNQPKDEKAPATEAPSSAEATEGKPAETAEVADVEAASETPAEAPADVSSEASATEEAPAETAETEAPAEVEAAAEPKEA
jgi:small subunit ribosomal protein S16